MKLQELYVSFFVLALAGLVISYVGLTDGSGFLLVLSNSLGIVGAITAWRVFTRKDVEIDSALFLDHSRGRSWRQVQFIESALRIITSSKIRKSMVTERFEEIDDLRAAGASDFQLQSEALGVAFWAIWYTLIELAKPTALLAALWRWIGN
ncbi:MAG: hypothetical protein AAF725_16985 [Acidobacteriota bacterium]